MRKLKLALAVLAVAALSVALVHVSLVYVFTPLPGPAPAPAVPVERYTLVSPAGQPPAQASGSLPVAAPRNITYTASMTLEVGDVKGAIEDVRNITAQLGGYVSTVNFEEKAAQEATVTVKVPAERYREALDRLSSVGRLKSLSESAVDVTEQWVDLSARLRNLRAEEERLLQLLEKASSLSDILQIEDRLANLRYQIEFYDAQLRNLERSITYATITVKLTPAGRPVEWPELDLVGAVVRGVGLAASVVAAIVTGLVGLSPLLLLGAAAYYAYKRLRAGASSRQRPGSPGTPSGPQA